VRELLRNFSEVEGPHKLALYLREKGNGASPNTATAHSRRHVNRIRCCFSRSGSSAAAAEHKNAPVHVL
jgi:hypothetical protein